MIEVKITDEYIKLDQLLKLAGIVGSGSDAHNLILDGFVKVNGEVEYQKRKKVRVNDIVEFEDEKIIVKEEIDESL